MVALKRIAVHIPWVSAFVFILVILLKYGVDFPFMDEWAAFSPGALDTNVTLTWLLGFHNEHRIFFTKLLTWGLYRSSGWNEVHNLIINAFIYLAYLLVLLDVARKTVSIRWFPLLLVPLLATTAWENWTWCFQSQFFFCLLFLSVSVGFGIARPCTWISRLIFAVAAISCEYSFSAGVPAIATIGLCVFIRDILSNEANGLKKYIALVLDLVPFVFLILWFDGYVHPSYHPQLVFPDKRQFWLGWFKLIGYGFGFENLRIQRIVGFGVASVIVAQLIWRGLSITNRVRDKSISWLVLCLGSLAMLAVITAGRANLTLDPSRYASFALLLVPSFFVSVVAWLNDLCCSSVFKKSIICALFVLLVCGFYNQYNRRALIAPLRERAECRTLVASKLAKSGPLVCPCAFPWDIRPRVDRAIELGIASRWIKDSHQ